MDPRDHRAARRRARTSTALAVLAAAAAPAAASGADAPAAEALLERHAPVLVHDARERSPATAVEAIRGGRLLARDGATIAGGGALEPLLLGARYGDTRRTASPDDRLDLPPPPGQPAPPTAYARFARGSDGRTWLQYWLFFLSNDQDRDPLRTGRHEGDWELVQVRLGPSRAPDRVTLSQHSWGERCSWREAVRDGGRPVVHVAHASHALYARPGTGDRPWPDPNDEARGDGTLVRPRVVPVSERSPSWVAWPGRWGGSEAGVVPGEHPSPRGPAHQPQGRWSDPSRWDAEHARPCGAGPPPRHAQTALLAAALAGLGALALRRRRHRRRDRR
jgi:hypothetical protein